MNPTMICRSSVASALALTASLGCGSGVVGVDPCRDGDVECAGLSLAKGGDGFPFPSWDVAQIEIQPLSELSIDWVKRLPGPAQPFGEGIAAAYYRVLQRNEVGELVLFFRDDDTRTLEIAHLDDKGEVVQRASVAAPADWAGGDDTHIGFMSCGSAMCVGERTPGLRVAWFTDSTQLDAPWMMQKLLFSSDINEPPQRQTLDNGVVDDMQQDRDGALYVISSDPDHNVTKRDAETGRQIWKETDFAQNTQFADGRRLYLSGVVLDDGNMVVLTGPLEDSMKSNLTFLDAKGERTQTPTWLPSAGYLLNAGDHATLVASSDGDILVLNMLDPTRNDGVQFVRDDYTLLRPEASAVDPSGNVYFGTHNGSRLGSKPTLCRAPASGGGDCYTMPEHARAGDDEAFRFDGIVAREHGELYIHSGFELVHVTYPE